MARRARPWPGEEMADAVSIHGPARHDIMGGTTQCGDRHRDRSAVELVGRIIGNQTKLRQEFMSEERRERETKAR